MPSVQRHYRLYIDESGDHVFHNQKTLGEPSHRYLALVGCWFEQYEPYLTFQRTLEQLKQKHFPHSPDETVVLHRNEIVNWRGAFRVLEDDNRRKAFDDDLCLLVASTSFRVVGICVDKLAMGQRYATPFHPYHLALGFMLQRYCGWLNRANHTGDVMAESRGGKEDGLLRDAYEHIRTRGDMHHDSAFYQRSLAMKKISFRKKESNIAGLQLCDILARAVRNDVLCDHGCPDAKITAFDARLLSSIRSKYNHQLYEGRVTGYGKVLFPK